MERVERIELSSKGWKPLIIAIIRYPHLHIIIKISQSFKKKFPKVAITPKGYDFSGSDKLPFKINSSENIIIFFPGSTIGNFEKRML